MVGRGEGQIGPPQAAAGPGEARESVRRAFVQEMAIDVEQDMTAGAFGHDVPGPDLVEESARGRHRASPDHPNRCEPSLSRFQRATGNAR